MVTAQSESAAAVRRITAAPAAGGPTAVRIMLGAQLRRLREAKRITLEDAGYVIRASGSKMSRLETGRVGFKPRDIADLLTLYGVTDDQERATLQELARQASTRGWWHDYADIVPAWFEPYVGLEEAAASIRCFEIQLVPGLLQTPGYARAIATLGHPAGSDAEIERRVSLQLARQAVLTRARAGAPVAGPRRGGAAAAGRRARGHARPARAPAGRRGPAERQPAGHPADPGRRTPRRAVRSRSCASVIPTCPTSSTSGSSPARSTWTSGRPSTTTWP